jgi:hypothetical protein
MRVLIVGHSPGKVQQSKSITRNRVKAWLQAANVEEYDWINLVNYHAPSLKFNEITLTSRDVIGYDKIIALGNMASVWLARNNISHLKVPHPSGLNRIWNDSTTEIKTMDSIKKYLETKHIYRV